MDPDGKNSGTFDKNSLTNSILYDVNFPGVAINSYVVNIIFQNMFSQIDTYGYSFTILDSIIYFPRVIRHPQRIKICKDSFRQ